MQERRTHRCTDLYWRPQLGEVHLELKHHYCNALSAGCLPQPQLAYHLYIRVPHLMSCIVLRNIACASGTIGA